ncbi:MAG: glycosyltransferase family 4 protein [Patescibacteria group bacterium]
MKILFISSDINQIGGIEKYNRIFLSSLREQGGDVFLIERKEGRFFSKLLFAIKVLFFAIFKNPDFIICTHLHFSPLCYFLKKFFGIQFSISVYGIETVKIKESFKKSLRLADVIIYLFEATAENILDQVRGVKERLFKLPNSVDENHFKILERSKDLLSRYGLSGSKVILTIGRMSVLDGDNKGYKRVIKAMPVVVKSIPEAKYLLVGGGDDVSNVRQLIHELHLEGSVILGDSPKNEELVDYYNLADVFVLPSKNEGFPAIVLLEALSCGVPVIGGNQKGAETALLNGALGLIVLSDDINSISDAITKVLKRDVSPELLDRNVLRSRTIGAYGTEAYQNQIKKLLDFIKIKVEEKK